MTVKELNDLSYENYNIEIYEETVVDEGLVEREYVCSTKTDSKGLKPYLNRKIIGYKLNNSLLDGVLIKLYLEAEKC